MKLTAHISINFPLLPVTRSFSRISIQFTGGYKININIKPDEIVLALKNSTCRYNYNVKPGNAVTINGNKQTNPEETIGYSTIKIVKNVMAEKNRPIYPLSNTGNKVNIAIIADYKKNNLALPNAGGNILSSTTPSKASVELPSLATGVYFVRVKNKVSGEATNLRFVKI